MILRKLLRVFLIGSVTSQVDMKPLDIMIHTDVGGNSHVKYLMEISEVLLKRGHTVTYATTEENFRFAKGYSINCVSIGSFKLKTPKLQKMYDKNYLSSKPVNILTSMGERFSYIYDMSYDIYYEGLSNLVKAQPPDVIICDLFAAACRDVAEMNNIPLIHGLQTTDIFRINPSPYITNTIDYGPTSTDKMSFYQRFIDGILNPIMDIYHLYPIVSVLNQHRAKYNVPPTYFAFGDYSRSLSIANTFVGFEAPGYQVPNIKMIGPILSETFTPLDSELKEFMLRHNKVLYIGFGSNVILSHLDIQNVLESALISLDLNLIDGVIWGLGNTKPSLFPNVINYNGSSIPSELFSSNQHPHIRLLLWAPQVALLNHDNIKLFFSHGGLESSFEAISSATPILCMPILGDQPRNARKLEDAGIGTYINRYTTTPQLITTQIQTILTDRDGTFRLNLKRMRNIALLHTNRKSLAADLIESFAINGRECRPQQPSKFGEPGCEARHLIPASISMPFISSHHLDVYLVTLILILGVVTTVGVALLKILSYIGFNSNSKLVREKRD